MFTPSSRYAKLPDLLYTGPDGRQRLYKGRRFLPQPQRLPSKGTVAVVAGDRPDLVAARAFGQSELYWRLADANGAMDPFALTAEPGRRLRVPVPQPLDSLPPVDG